MEFKILEDFWKRFCIFQSKNGLQGFPKDKNSFLKIKYVYTIALTLGCLLAGSKGLKASY
jgi:hypothetical protein